MADFRSVEDILADYKDGKYDINIENYDTKQWPKDKVVDENQSVRWNREQVEAHNINVTNERQRYLSDCSTMRKKLREDLHKAVAEGFSLSDSAADKILEFCCDRWSTSMVDMMDNLWDISRLVESCISSS